LPVQTNRAVKRKQQSFGGNSLSLAASQSHNRFQHNAAGEFCGTSCSGTSEDFQPKPIGGILRQSQQKGFCSMARSLPVNAARFSGFADVYDR
jgi:hypothetical protein